MTHSRADANLLSMQTDRQGWFHSKVSGLSLLVSLIRAHKLDLKGDLRGALSLIQKATPFSQYEAVRRAYVAQLMVRSRPTDAIVYLTDLAAYITKLDRKHAYRNYCVHYCEYLRCVLLSPEDTNAAAAKVKTAQSSPVIRKILVVLK